MNKANPHVLLVLLNIVLISSGYQAATAGEIVFAERWNSAKITISDEAALVRADEGTWILGDTVSEFPECGPIPHRAEIVSQGGKKALRLTSGDSLSSCSDNVWAVLYLKSFPELGNEQTVPITPNTILSFTESGTLVDPEPASSWCRDNPICGDMVSLTVEDNHGSGITYVLQRAPVEQPIQARNFYREIFLHPDAGVYSRNLFEDFRTLPAFNPIGAEIRAIDFTINEHGSAAIGDIVVETRAPVANYTNVWWAPSRSGQGVQILQNGTTISGAWYLYDEVGAGMWLTFITSLSGNRASAELLRFSGPALGATWDSNSVRNRPVGTVTVDFNSPTSILFSTIVNGISESLSLQPFDEAADGQYSNVWWDRARSGQGIQILHSGSTVSGAWYLYDENGSAMWLTFVGNLAGNTLVADLLRFTGPALGTLWDSAQVSNTPVGKVNINFTSPTSASFNFSINAVSGTLTLEPFSL